MKTTKIIFKSFKNIIYLPKERKEWQAEKARQKNT